MYNHQLDLFLAIAESGSFSSAARQLYITPSAVVQKVNALEEQLGVRLFRRTPQGVKLTPAGEILEKEAPRLILLSSEILNRIQAAGHPKTICVGWKSEVEDSSFLSACAGFRDTHPDITVEISNLKGDVFSAIRNEEIDLCQYMNSPLYAEYGYAFFPVFRARQCIVMAETHPLAQRECITPEDLEEHPLIVLKKGILSDHDAFHALAESRKKPLQLLPRENYGEETQAECFQHNYAFLGTGVMNRWYSPLRSVPVSWDLPVEIGLVYRANASPQLGEMVRYLSRKEMPDPV